MEKFLKKNYKKIIIICLIMLILSNKMYENFTAAQALDGVKSTEKKVNDMFYKVDKDWISTNKNIYSSKEIKSNVAVKVGTITLAKKDNKIWAPNMQVDNLRVKKNLHTDGDVKGKRLCIGGTCIGETQLKVLLGKQKIWIQSSRGGHLSDQGGWKGKGSWEQMYIRT